MLVMPSPKTYPNPITTHEKSGRQFHLHSIHRLRHVSATRPRRLVRSPPRKNIFEIPALVERVEIRVWPAVILDPIVRVHADVGVAH